MIKLTKKPVYKRKKSKLKLFAFLVLTIIVGTFAYVTFNLDTKILPPVLAIVDKTAKNKINHAIDNSLEKIVLEDKLVANSFYEKTTDEFGMVNSISVNTVLVNSVCSKLSTDISDQLEEIHSIEVKIPIAIMFNTQTFSNVGPTYPISILPIGDATADYETKFEAVGINQVNFKMWLKVDCAVRVTNPLQKNDIIVTRKIALIDTIYSGKVPETYLNNVPYAPIK